MHSSLRHITGHFDGNVCIRVLNSDLGDTSQDFEKQLQEYFDGKRTSFSLSYRFEWGTALQRRVWSEIAKIPYGETISYRELARRAGSPMAIRAAASACGKNPLPIIVPCHRVVASDGTLGGFTWGLGAKSWLLEHERGHAKV